MRTSLSLMALVASAGFSFAADQAPHPGGLPLDPAPQWTGIYFGGSLGGNMAGGDYTLASGAYALPAQGFLSAASLANDSAATNALSGNNVFRQGAKLKGGHAPEVGLFGGYQYQMDAIVVGVEADVNYARQNAKARAGGELDIFGAYAHPTCATCAGDTASADGLLKGAIRSNMLWNSSLRLRAGVLATDRMLVFGTGGLIVGAFQRSLTASGSTVFFDDAATPAAQATHTFSGGKTSNQYRLGWTLGLGVDYRVSAGWSLRAEYRYADFGRSDLKTSVTTTCAETVAGACAKLAPGAGSLAARFADGSHALRVGMSYQFGDRTAAVLARY